MIIIIISSSSISISFVLIIISIFYFIFQIGVAPLSVDARPSFVEDDGLRYPWTIINAW